MKTYFKYTDGSALTLDGDDYTGFFNLVGDTPYTQRTYNSDSEPLEYKTTFMANVYKDKLEFNTTFNHLPVQDLYLSNVFDTLNSQGFIDMTDSVNYNNLICFKAFNIYNPTIYNFEKNDNLYYGVYSPSDTLVSKQTYSHIDPFSSYPGWGFADQINTGAVFVNSQEEFKYICSTGEHDYVLKGSFVHPNKLEIIYSKDLHPRYTLTPDYTYSIHNDIENSRIFIVNNDYIRIYDTSNYDECENLPLIDQISLKPTSTFDHIFGKTHYKFGSFHYKPKVKYHTYNDNNPQFIKFGKNVRTHVSGNVITFVNKYSSMEYQSINLTDYGVETIVDLDVSPSTDDLIVLHKTGGEFKLFVMYGMDSTDYADTTLKSIKTSSWNKIKFSNVDSDQFYLYGENEVQTRSISTPEYPVGRMETGELLYFKRYKFSEAKEKFSNIRMKFSSGLYKSNNFNVLAVSETVKSDNMYMILHNVGRIYALKQPISDYLLSIVPTNLEKYFTGVKGSESSLGLYLNSTLSNLLKDTLNLLTNSEGKFVFEEYKIMVDSLNEAEVDMINLLMNGNETINVITLQRILATISDIQYKLLPE